MLIIHVRTARKKREAKEGEFTTELGISAMLRNMNYCLFFDNNVNNYVEEINAFVLCWECN